MARIHCRTGRAFTYSTTLSWRKDAKVYIAFIYPGTLCSNHWRCGSMPNGRPGVLNFTGKAMEKFKEIKLHDIIALPHQTDGFTFQSDCVGIPCIPFSCPCIPLSCQWNSQKIHQVLKFFLSICVQKLVVGITLPILPTSELACFGLLCVCVHVDGEILVM